MILVFNPELRFIIVRKNRPLLLWIILLIRRLGFIPFRGFAVIRGVFLSLSFNFSKY